MAKLAPTSTKYVIRAQIKANGIVERPDIIGAVFGQTEGLLGNDLDLRELQRTGRIGRIDVKIDSKNGSSEGEIIIPSSLDASETALIAATLETIERVGPCTAEIKLLEVEDTRADKRKYVVDKAKEILQRLSDTGGPDSTEISEHIKEAVRTEEITEIFGLTAGPGVVESEELIIVEGRADVVNLLKHGVRNAVAVGGTSASPQIVDLAKKKTVTLFVDGDRGGKLIAKELSQMIDIDYVAVAPENKEVEELAKKEVFKALRDKIPADQFGDIVARKNKVEKAEKPAERTERPERTFERRERPERAARPENEDDFVPQQSRFEGPSRFERGSSRGGFSRGPPRGDSRGPRRDSRPPREGFSRDRPPREGGFSRDSRGPPRDSRGPPREGGFSRGPRRDFPPREGFSREGFGDAPRRKARISESEKELFIRTLNELKGSGAACIFNHRNELMGKVPLAELEETIRTIDDPYAVIMDGKVDYKISEAAFRKKVKFIIGTDKDDLRTSVTVLSKKELEESKQEPEPLDQ